MSIVKSFGREIKMPVECDRLRDVHTCHFTDGITPGLDAIRKALSRTFDAAEIAAFRGEPWRESIQRAHERLKPRTGGAGRSGSRCSG